MSGIIGGIISGVGNYLGAGIAADGAKDAAKIQGKYNLQAIDKVAGYTKEARDEVRAAAGRGLGHIDTGLAQYTSRISPLLTARPIQLPAYRGLTTQQTLGLGDLRRGAQAGLASSGQRGSGRGGIGAALDQERRYIAGARGANDADAIGERRRAQGSADAATSGLANAQLGVGGAKAGVETGTGNTIANSLTHTGDVAGQLTASTGQAYGNAANTAAQNYGAATIATTNTLGQGVGQMLGSPNQGGLASLWSSGGNDTGAWNV